MSDPLFYGSPVYQRCKDTESDIPELNEFVEEVRGLGFHIDYVYDEKTSMYFVYLDIGDEEYFTARLSKDSSSQQVREAIARMRRSFSLQLKK